MQNDEKELERVKAEENRHMSVSVRCDMAFYLVPAKINPQRLVFVPACRFSFICPPLYACEWCVLN